MINKIKSRFYKNLVKEAYEDMTEEEAMRFESKFGWILLRIFEENNELRRRVEKLERVIKND